MAKIKQQSLADQVYSQVKDEILNGKLKANDRISEEDLAELYGVSRTPIRDALKKLADYGLIKIIPRSHAIVNSVSPEEAQDIAKLRITLEQFSIDNLTEESLNENFEDLCRYASECQFALSMSNKAKVFENDSLFHITLIKISNNYSLVDLYTRLDAKVQLLRLEQDTSMEDLTKYISQHNEIIDLLKKRKFNELKELLCSHIMHDLTNHIN